MIEKDIEEFAWKNQAAGRRHARCRTCVSAVSREHYAKFRDDYLERTKRRRGKCREENQRRILEYLSLHPCVDCGETDVVVLEFDHRGNKSFTVAYMMQFIQWPKMEAEIAKCDVRCANCHRRKTAAELGHWRFKVLDSGEPDPVIVGVPEIGPLGR